MAEALGSIPTGCNILRVFSWFYKMLFRKNSIMLNISIWPEDPSVNYFNWFKLIMMATDFYENDRLHCRGFFLKFSFQRMW